MFSPAVFIVINAEIKELKKILTKFYRSHESNDSHALTGHMTKARIDALNRLKKALRKAGIRG